MSTQIRRLDRYTIEVNGHRVSATPSQEEALRSMSDGQIARFLIAMGRVPAPTEARQSAGGGERP